MQPNTTNELVEIIYGISRLLKREMSYTNNLVHLSILQIQTLLYLKQNEKASMSDIADNFHIELPSATSLVNKLCEQKLVQRFEDQEDRRLVRINLTPIGISLLDEAMQERRAKLEKILGYLPDQEKNQLLNIFKTINTKLQQS
jgi:DNA-binding MarR family transcriptional regulator